MLAILLPPGSVFFGSTDSPNLWWMIGPLSIGVFTLLIARKALLQCDKELHLWYDRNHCMNVVN